MNPTFQALALINEVFPIDGACPNTPGFAGSHSITLNPAKTSIQYNIWWLDRVWIIVSDDPNEPEPTAAVLEEFKAQFSVRAA